MTNQVNQYEHHMAIQEAYQIHDSDEYFKARPQLECGDRRKVFYAGHIRGYQAATKASESEINSLKQRVVELDAENTIMRDALNKIALGYVYDADIIESAGDCLQRLSNTKSLAEHDNDVLERCAIACESIREADYCVDVRAGSEAIRSLKTTS